MQEHQIINGKVDVLGRGRVQGPRQVAREDRRMHASSRSLIRKLSATIAIDEFRQSLPANQSHVVTRHQQLCRSNEPYEATKIEFRANWSSRLRLLQRPFHHASPIATYKLWRCSVGPALRSKHKSAGLAYGTRYNNPSVGNPPKSLAHISQSPVASKSYFCNGPYSVGRATKAVFNPI